MFAGLACSTGSTDRAASSQLPTPLDLTLVPPKRHLEDGAAPLDLSVKKPKEDDVSDDVIIVGMQQAPARYCPVDVSGRVPPYYGGSVAAKGRPQECEQGFSSGARARSLNALCTSSPHQRRSASQVEFLRRWSREPGVNICAQAPPRLSESEAAHAYERSRESRPHQPVAREMTPQPGCDYMGRDVIPMTGATSSHHLLQQQLLQQQHHMHILKQQQQQLQQHRLSRHADMLDRRHSASRGSPAVCPSPALPPSHPSSQRLPVGVDVNSRQAQVNTSRRPYPGSETHQYDRTVSPHDVHIARTLHSGPYSVIQTMAVGDNTGYTYAHEKEQARTPHPFVPKPRDRSISDERPLSSAEVEQHIRKSLDQAVSLVQASRVSSRQHTPISASSLFPVRPEVDMLRCSTSGSALYCAMLNGSEPIGQPKVAIPAGSVPLVKSRYGAMMKTPGSVLFRSPEGVPRSRGDGAPPNLYSPHLCLPDNRPAAPGRRSAEQRRIAIGADGFNHRNIVRPAVLRGSDPSGCDETGRGHSLPSSTPESTRGDPVASSVTSSQGRGLEQLRHAPYLLSMLTSSQKAELSSSEQYDHVTGIVRRRDATPAGGICVAGPQDRFVSPYAIPAKHVDSRLRAEIANANQQLASRKKPESGPTNISNDAVTRPETTSSSMSSKMANCHSRDSGVEAQMVTDGDAYGRGPTQQTLPSGIRYYKCPKPFTKLPTGDLVSAEKFPSKPIPVANVNPIVKSACKMGVRAPEYHEKTTRSAAAPGDFSRVSASTFTSGVLATTGCGDTLTKHCTVGFHATNAAPKKAIAAKTEYSHKDSPKKCAAGVSQHPVRTDGDKDPPQTKDSSLCSRRDLALYLSTPKGRQKLKLRDNLSHIGVSESSNCKPTTAITSSEVCVASDHQMALRVDTPSCCDVKPPGGDLTSVCHLTNNANLSSKTKVYADLINTHTPSARDNSATDDCDRKPDTKSTCPTASSNVDNSTAHAKSDSDKDIATDSSLSRGPRPDKFITRKSRILESIRKKNGQQVARMSRLKSQHPEKCVKRRNPAEVPKTKERSVLTKVITGARKRKLRRSRRLTGRDATTIDLPLVARIKSAPRRSRRVTSYNKNAAYEEELQKDEERRLLLRAKRYAHRHQTNHVTTTRVIPKQLCRLRSTRQNRVLASRKRKQLSSLNANIDAAAADDGGDTSLEHPETAEDEDEKCTEEECVDVKPETGEVCNNAECSSSQRGSVGERLAKGKPKKGVLVGDSYPSDDVKFEPGAISQLVAHPSGRDIKLPTVIKGIVNGIRRYRKRRTKAYYMLSHEHRRRHRLLVKNRGSAAVVRRDQPAYRRPSLAVRLSPARASSLPVPLGQVKAEPVDFNASYDPYGEETETEEGDEEARGGTDVAGVTDAKRLVVCKKTGETTLHKAARLGYESVVAACIDSQLSLVNVRDNAGYTPLHESCVAGGLPIVERLLAAGADVNAASQDGTRPIHDAVDNDHLEIVRLLLSVGADPTISTYSGRTPLKLARSADMEAFLKGYFSDLNGLEAGDSGPWHFRYSTGVVNDSVVESGCDIFNDVPSDPEEEDDVVEFTFCADPELFAYHLCLSPTKGASNYYSASDVARRLDVSVEHLAATYGDRLTLAAAGRAQLKEQLYPSCILQVPHIKALLAESEVNMFSFVEVDDAARQLLGDITATVPLFDTPVGATRGGDVAKHESDDVPGNANAKDSRPRADKGVSENSTRRTPTNENAAGNRCAVERGDPSENRKESVKDDGDGITKERAISLRKKPDHVPRVASAEDKFKATRAVDKASRRYRSPAESKPPVNAVHVTDNVSGMHDSDAAPSTVRADASHSPETVIRETKRRNDLGSFVEPGRVRCSNQQVNDLEPTCDVRRATSKGRRHKFAAALSSNGVASADENGRTPVKTLDRLVKLAEERAASLSSTNRPICPATPSGDKTHKTAACNSAQLSEFAPTPSCCHSNVADDASTSDDPALPVLEKHEIERETEPATPNSQPVRSDSVYDDSEMPELICCAY